MKITKNQIKGLPKIDLHRHIDGDVNFETILELAKDQKKKLPVNNIEGLKKLFRKYTDNGFMTLIIEGFGLVTSLLQNKEALERAAFESVRNAASDNIIYAEFRFAPERHTEQGLSISDAIHAAKRGLNKGENSYNIKTNLIVSICRDSSKEKGIEIAKAIMESGNEVSAIDLACNEIGNPPEKHIEAYKITFGSEIKRTVHAGEIGKDKDKYNNILNSIVKLKADRISHATNIIHYNNLVNLVEKNNIGIEMSPLSNIFCNIISSSKELGIDKLVKHGIKLSINSDDPAMFNYKLSDVLNDVANNYNFNINDLKILQQNAVDSSFAENCFLT